MSSTNKNTQTLLEVKRGNEVLDEEVTTAKLQSPVQVTFTIEEELYKKLNQAADFYKYTVSGAFEIFCENAEKFISAMDMM